jgi:hypothetical protein
MSKPEKKPPKYLQKIDPTATIGQSPKYKLGKDKPAGVHQNLKHTPTFSFEKLNLNCSELCYNYEKLTTDDYHKFFDKLRLLSSVTYEEMKNSPKQFRFHDVDFEDKSVTVNLQNFKKAIVPNPSLLKDEDVPTCYQFEAFEEARVFGYLGYNGLFHLVWFDRHHNIYKRK